MKKVGEIICDAIREAGGVPYEFNTIAVCDGIAMGHSGMKYSLASREIIADSVETMGSAHPFDAMICIPNCDKVVPGMLMGAMRLDIPTMLASGVDQVRAALSQADDYNAVMVDVKSIFGSFYYSNAISGAAKATVLDIKQVDQLIAELAQQKGVTLIARVPAFSDPEYALKHQSQALPLYNGALWTDEHDCYWLNPYSNDVQGYLTSIALELANLGFDEVLFDDFYFPDSDRISWTGSVTKQEAILDAADNLSANLLNQAIRLDLGTSDPEVAAYASRVFIETNNASQIDSDKELLADAIPDPAAGIVYITDSRDTRFDACGAMRPLLDETE